jgi:hypothetical protein
VAALSFPFSHTIFSPQKGTWVSLQLIFAARSKAWSKVQREPSTPSCASEKFPASAPQAIARFLVHFVHCC